MDVHENSTARPIARCYRPCNSLRNSSAQYLVGLVMDELDRRFPNLREVHIFDETDSRL